MSARPRHCAQCKRAPILEGPDPDGIWRCFWHSRAPCGAAERKASAPVQPRRGQRGPRPMPPPKKAKGSPPIPAPSRYDSAERARIVEAFGRIDTAEGRTELRALIGTLVTRGEMDKPVAEVLASLVANQARDKGAAKPPSTASVALRLRPEAESDEVDLFDPPADMLPQ